MLRAGRRTTTWWDSGTSTEEDSNRFPSRRMITSIKLCDMRNETLCVPISLPRWKNGGGPVCGFASLARQNIASCFPVGRFLARASGCGTLTSLRRTQSLKPYDEVASVGPLTAVRNGSKTPQANWDSKQRCASPEDRRSNKLDLSPFVPCPRLSPVFGCHNTHS